MAKGFRRRGRKRFGRGRMLGGKTKKLVTGQTQPTMLEKIASGIGAAASVAKAVLPIVSAINTESKYIDVAANAGIPIGTPTLQTLTAIAQGTDENNRIGNSVLLKHINIRISFIPNFTADAYNLMRYIIFVDKQQSGTPPTAAQLLTTPGNIDSPFNRNYTDRFVILKDKRLVASQTGLITSSIFQKVFKRLNFHTRFIGTSSANASMGNNTVYFFAVSTQVINAPTAFIYSRINFTDN